MTIMHDPGLSAGTTQILPDSRHTHKRSIGRVLHKRMNSDDLPVYPTPQQATYAMPQSGQPSSRRSAKPQPYQQSNTAPPPPSTHSSSSSAFNGHANFNMQQAPDYGYQQSRSYQAQPSHQQSQYYQQQPQQQQSHHPQQQPQQPYQSQQIQNQQQHATSHYSHQNAYQSNGHTSASVQQHRPVPVPTPNTPNQYFSNGSQTAAQNVPAPRAASASSSYYGSAPQSVLSHQNTSYQQSPSQSSSGQRSASYSGQQYAQPAVPTSSPPPAHSPTTTQASGRSHGPLKKAPPNSNSRSRESVDEAPKASSKQRLEAELRATFDRVDTNHSGKISARELSAALINFDNTGFQHSTVRLMIKLFSNPASGSSSGLNFEQFVSLWKYLTAYKKLFVAADVNKSGDISFGEFQRIIEQIGYKLNVDLVLHLFQKFANKESHDDGSIAVGKLKFDAFIELLVYLRKLTDIFKQYDKQLTGVATIDYSDFLLEISNLT